MTEVSKAGEPKTALTQTALSVLLNLCVFVLLINGCFDSKRKL